MDHIRGPRDKHPSGKPLRRDKKPGYADGYRNQDKPRTARLRSERKINAIGFTANLICDDEE